MEKRTLGSHGLVVSALGLGCMGMSEFYGTADEGENLQKNLALVERVKEMATEKHVTAGQLALAWSLARGKDIVPIPGTKHRKYLEENVAAVGITLTREDLARIEEVTPKGVAAGERYADADMSVVNR